MTADRIAGIGGLAMGVLFFYLAGDSEAYLFPRSIAIAMTSLGLAILASTLRARSRSTPAVDRPGTAWRRIVPALAVFVAYGWAMEAIGFYSAGFAAFLTIVWIYTPEPLTVRAAAKRIAISAAFISVIFVLFSLLLRVQTPRGILL